MIITQLPPQPIPLAVTVLVVLAASTDLVARRVPNVLVAAGLVLAFAVQVWLRGPLGGAAQWIEGILTGLVLLLPVYLLGGMAAGDVKLLMGVGAWVGPDMTFSVALITFLAGGVWGLALALRRGRVRPLLKNLGFLLSALWQPGRKFVPPDQLPAESIGTIPYAVAIAAGTLGMLWSLAN